MQAVLEEHIPGLCWVNGIVHPAHESCCHVSVIVELFDMGQLSHKGQVNSYLVYTLSGQYQLSQFQNPYHKSSCRKNRTSNFSTPWQHFVNRCTPIWRICDKNNTEKNNTWTNKRVWEIHWHCYNPFILTAFVVFNWHGCFDVVRDIHTTDNDYI
jgi:hypothetical protein